MRILYYYHRIMRAIHKRKGSWQTRKFEYHHHKMKHYAGLLLVVLLLFNSTATAGTQTDEEKSISAAQKIIKASVKIDPGLLENGSGFYIAPNVILTNEHVTHNASGDISFKLQNGQYCKGSIGYREETIDLALISTDCTNNTFLTFNKEAQEGQSVLVMGNPLTFEFTLTKGIVSGWHHEFMQVDAKINYGSSGGPVANLNGEVIGIIAQKAKGLDYIGLAIPSRDVERFLNSSGFERSR